MVVTCALVVMLFVDMHILELNTYSYNNYFIYNILISLTLNLQFFIHIFDACTMAI